MAYRLCLATLCALVLTTSACRDGVASFVRPAPEPQTGPVRRITWSGFTDANPTWSHTGDSIYYSVSGFFDYPKYSFTMMKIPIDGGSATLLDSNLQFDPSAAMVLPPVQRPVESPDGTKLGYFEMRCTCAGCLQQLGCDPLLLTLLRLHVRDAGDVGLAFFDRSIDLNVAAQPPSLAAYRFSWSPDGTRIAFGDDTGLSIWDVGNSTVTPIPNTIAASAPAWSPDGSAIAFERNGEVSRTTIDGSVNDLTAGSEPAWSHDGKDIFFIASNRVQRMTLATRAISVIAKTDSARSPSPSPDGHWLAFQKASSKSNLDLYIVDLSNGGSN